MSTKPSQDEETAPASANPAPPAPLLHTGLRQRNSRLGLMLASWAISAFAIAIIVAIVVHYVELHHVLAAH